MYRPQGLIFYLFSFICSYTVAPQNPTLTPWAGLATISAFIFCSSAVQYFEMESNLCIILTIVYPISVKANCCPIQILGPPLKGMYVQLFGVHFSQRSGQYSEACGKSGDSAGYRSILRCMCKQEYAMGVSFSTPRSVSATFA